MKRYSYLAAIALATLATLNVPGSSAQSTYPTVYLEAKDEFANDFSAAVSRKNVPVTLTTDRQQAGYVAHLTWATNEGSKTRGLITVFIVGAYMSGSYERVSMSVFERESKKFIYSYTCQKVGWRMQTVAECLATHWKASLKNGKIKLRESSPSDLEQIQDAQTGPTSAREDVIQGQP